jgi:hypothetical protein
MGDEGDSAEVRRAAALLELQRRVKQDGDAAVVKLIAVARMIREIPPDVIRAAEVICARAGNDQPKPGLNAPTDSQDELSGRESKQAEDLVALLSPAVADAMTMIPGAEELSTEEIAELIAEVLAEA